MLSIVKLQFLWLSLVGKSIPTLLGYSGLELITTPVIALILTITNTVAFSRCDKFSQASNLASSAFYSGGLARNVAGSMFSRFFTR